MAIEEHIADLALAVQFTIQGWGETKRKINLGGAVFITTTCVKAVSPKYISSIKTPMKFI